MYLSFSARAQGGIYFVAAAQKEQDDPNGAVLLFFIQRGIRTEDPSVKKTCRWHVFRSESPRAGPRAGGESAGLPGERARKKIHNLRIFLSWKAKPNPSGRAMKGRQNRCRPVFFRFHAGLRAF